MRVEDKSEKEEYELLYDQLSSYWQEKVVKEERTQKDHKYWVRMGTVKGLKRRDLIDLLEEEELKYQRVVEQGNGFNIQCDNDEEVSRALEMDGLQVSNQPLRVTRTNKSMKVKDIFQLVEEHLKIKEEALSRGKKTEGHRRVHSTEKEPETKPKVELKIEEKTTIEPLKTFRPAPAHRRPQPGPPASHFAGFPGNGAPHSSSNPNWPQNPSTGWGPGSHNGYNAGYADYPRPTTPAPGKGAGAAQFTEWLHSGKGNQGRGKGGKGHPSTRTVAPIQTNIFVPTPDTRNSKCKCCEKEGREFQHGF